MAKMADLRTHKITTCKTYIVLAVVRALRFTITEQTFIVPVSFIKIICNLKINKTNMNFLVFYCNKNIIYSIKIFL